MMMALSGLTLAAILAGVGLAAKQIAEDVYHPICFPAFLVMFFTWFGSAILTVWMLFWLVFPPHQYQVQTADGKVYVTGSPVYERPYAEGIQFQDDKGRWVYTNNAELRDLGVAPWWK